MIRGAVRVVVGGALVAGGWRALEYGLDLLTRPGTHPVVQEAEDVARAAADPAPQEGPR